MKLSELKVGRQFRTASGGRINEFRESRTRKDGTTEFVCWNDDGFDIFFVDREVIPIPTHEYKVGDWVQCDSVDGMSERNREFMRVGAKYTIDSFLELDGKMTSQMRNTIGKCDAVYYWLDRFSPTEEPKPQYKPYSDLRVLAGKVLVQVRLDGNSPLHQMVTDASESSAWLGNKTRNPNEILSGWTYLDGTLCGELVEE